MVGFILGGWNNAGEIGRKKSVEGGMYKFIQEQLGDDDVDPSKNS